MLRVDIAQSIAILLLTFVVAVHIWFDDRRDKRNKRKRR